VVPLFKDTQFETPVQSPVGAALTVTVAVLVTEPSALVAVKVYVVVAVGETVVEVPVTAPTPLLIDKLVAPVTVQDRVLDWPVVIVAGLAVKEEMLGGVGVGVLPVEVGTTT
jgi:hypothetical protein